ncbi:MAG: DUF922 domain-containing Zn-dependent protease [Thermodesulfobacteriota bacterium]
MAVFRTFSGQVSGFLCLLALPAIAWSVSFAYAEPSVTERYVFYDVRGSTAAELRNNMNRLGTKASDGKTYDGFINWNVGWRFKYVPTASGCAMTRVQAIVDISYTMPRWVGRHAAPRELRDKWDRFCEALKRHEEGHKNIAVKGASEIERALLTMSSRDCVQLDAKANALGERLLEKIREREREYDALTNHGITQGTRFP